MSSYFFKNIPAYHMDGFCAVRDSFDNLRNTLKIVEIVNTCQSHLSDSDDDFDIALFIGSYKRAVIRKSDGYFSMSIPFQVVKINDYIYFNFDLIKEEVNGRLISILRNAIETTKNSFFSHEDIVYSLCENLGLDTPDAIRYCDAFSAILSDDHGYFRFDDDPINQNGSIHPRYHFDFFYKNHSSIKIGYRKLAKIDCFYSLFDSKKDKKYLS